MNSVDKEQVNQRIIEVCEHYLGPGRGGGERRTWVCPQCGKTNFRVNAGRRIGGCFSAGCLAPTATDAIGLIGYFEGLGDYGREFLERIEKGYDLLGLREPVEKAVGGSERLRSSATTQQAAHVREEAPPASSHADTRQKMRWMAGKGPQSAPQASGNGEQPARDAEEPQGQPKRVREKPLEAYIEGPGGLREPAEVVAVEEVDEESYRRETADAVYRRILELCPIEQRDLRFWTSRGVVAETVKLGKFGSLSAKRHHDLVNQLEWEFGAEALLCVSGFYETQRGQLGFNLCGSDYTLIPYHDAQGYITTIEGRVPGEPRGEEAKYKALLNSGAHLYVFPEYRPREVVAFCEGAVGAVVAAQSGIPVASIKGFRAHRSWSEGGYGPLPELRGVDFGGRRVLYIPDTDVKPKVQAEVEAEAPTACEWLISRQNGRPALAQLPEGYKDLDEWLLSVPAGERVEAFARLVKEALSPEQWLEKVQSKGRAPGESPAGASPNPPPAVPPQERAGADEEQTTEIPVVKGNGPEDEDDTTEIPVVAGESQSRPDDQEQSRNTTDAGGLEAEEGYNTASEANSAALQEAAATEDRREGRRGDPSSREPDTPNDGDGADVPQQAAQLELGGEGFFDNASQSAGATYQRRNVRKSRKRRGNPEVEREASKGREEGQDEGNATEAANSGASRSDSEPSGEKTPQADVESDGDSHEGRSGHEPGHNHRDEEKTTEGAQGENVQKRPMRESQAKWYRTLERTPRYRPPEERNQKVAPEPKEPSSKYVMPDTNWAEGVVALFVLAIIYTGLWFSWEYVWTETMLASPLGWFDTQIRLYFYSLSGSLISFGVWAWRYKKRRRQLIRHLTGGRREK